MLVEDIFSTLEYHTLYILYPFMTYLLILLLTKPSDCGTLAGKYYSKKFLMQVSDSRQIT
jgi:hypothetical protein